MNTKITRREVEDKIAEINRKKITQKFGIMHWVYEGQLDVLYWVLGKDKHEEEMKKINEALACKEL